MCMCAYVYKVCKCVCVFSGHVWFLTTVFTTNIITTTMINHDITTTTTMTTTTTTIMTTTTYSGHFTELDYPEEPWRDLREVLETPGLSQESPRNSRLLKESLQSVLESRSRQDGGRSPQDDWDLGDKTEVSRRRLPSQLIDKRWLILFMPILSMIDSIHAHSVHDWYYSCPSCPWLILFMHILSIIDSIPNNLHEA